MRREVEALLDQDAETGSFLNRPVIGATADSTDLPLTEYPHESDAPAKHRSVPWWIWIIAASFLLNFALVLYLDFEGPVLGMDSTFTQTGVVVTQVYPHSPAMAA